MTEDLDAFLDWTREIIELALECLDVASGEMLVVIGYDSGERKIMRVEHPGGTDELGSQRLQFGREVVAEFDDAQYYGMLWSGTRAHEVPELREVIALEVGSQSGRSSFLTQPYRVTDDDCLEAVGQPQMARHGVENIWSLKQGIAWSTADSSVGEEADENRTFEPISTLEDLGQRALDFALFRMTTGTEVPFACLVDSETGRGRIVPGEPRTADYSELAAKLREYVAGEDQSQMYAIVYFGVIQRGTKEIDIVTAETGARDGAQAVFGRTFDVSKSTLKTGGIECLGLADKVNLWQTPSVSDA